MAMDFCSSGVLLFWFSTTGKLQFFEVMGRPRSSIRGGETEETIQRSPDDFGMMIEGLGGVENRYELPKCFVGTSKIDSLQLVLRTILIINLDHP